MILVFYEMDVLPEKQKEFLQAVPKILEVTPEQGGCLHHHVCRDLSDDHRFFVIQAWKDQLDLDTHWRSDRFSTFLGSSHLLKRPPSVNIHAISFTAGMESIKAARAKLQSSDNKTK